MRPLEAVTAALRDRPHSFHHLRRCTGLKLTDQQFRALIRANPTTFAFTRFVRKDAAGNRLRPGLPDMKLRDAAPAG